MANVVVRVCEREVHSVATVEEVEMDMRLKKLPSPKREEKSMI